MNILKNIKAFVHQIADIPKTHSNVFKFRSTLKQSTTNFLKALSSRRLPFSY